MKLLFSLILFSISHSAFAANSCLDISGKYSLPSNTAEQKTTLIYSQSGCDWLIITGTHLTRGGVTVLPEGHYTLDGSRPKNCQNGILLTCAAYKVVGQEIAKVLSDFALADGGEHGVCEYTTSVLTKDAQGNLLETIMDARCEDAYIGKLKPIVFAKQK